MAVVASLVVAALVWILLPDTPTRAELGPPPGDTSETGSARESRAAELVKRLERALELNDVPAAGELAADPRSVRELRRLAGTVQDLDLTLLDLRYVSAATASERDRDRWGPDAFVAAVDLSWQLKGLDSQPSTVEVPLVLVDDGGTVSFATARKPAPRAPIWFNDKVRVERPRAGVLVVSSAAAGSEDLGELARGGVQTVRSALPAWDGRAVIEAPRTSARFAQASGMAPDGARGIAAVTTSSDGAVAKGAPSRVFLNPGVFGPLGTRGQQIVVSHELTHVAVDGASSTMPLWLSEGYADFVALRQTDVPERTLAAQIINLVRSDGLPDALPGGEQFDGTDPDVGAWYESAWLAARLLAREHGEPALHAFYRRADRDGGTDRAFEQLGTSEQDFTQRWRAELERLSR